MRILLLMSLAVLVWASPCLVQAQSTSVTALADTTVTNASAVLISAAGPTQYALNCTNLGNDHLRWGDSTITATKGQRLPSGASIEIITRSAIYMIAEATSATVTCTKEIR